MSHLFDENSDYDDAEDLPTLTFKKFPQNGKSKIKSADEENLNDSIGGKFVLLNKAKNIDSDSLENNAPLPAEPVTSAKQKKKDRKRKLIEETTSANDKSEQVSLKKHKKDKGPPQKVSVTPAPALKTKSKPAQPLLKDKLVDKLKGSRFRYLNELMYSSKGADAVKLFKEDPAAFTAYHEGYRHQISKWPMNPLQRIIKSFKKLPKNHVVADFGCGDALLSKSIPNTVHSLDLVAVEDGVIECDMAKTPLESNSVDVVVYCLSLMGTNLNDFFAEANRVLKMSGQIRIAEVSSRFQNVNHFIRDVKNCGFELVTKDLNDKLFYFFNFKKVQPFDTTKKLKEFSLSPCLYKKR